MFMMVVGHECSGREVFKTWKVKPTLDDIVSKDINEDHAKELLQKGHTVVYATDYFGEIDQVDIYLYEAHRLGSSYGQAD